MPPACLPPAAAAVQASTEELLKCHSQAHIDKVSLQHDCLAVYLVHACSSRQQCSLWHAMLRAHTTVGSACQEMQHWLAVGCSSPRVHARGEEQSTASHCCITWHANEKEAKVVCANQQLNKWFDGCVEPSQTLGAACSCHAVVAVGSVQACVIMLVSKPPNLTCAAVLHGNKW